MTTETLRIYVACLASYNAGRLHGRWIDVTDLDADDIGAEIANMLQGSPARNAEEYAVHDYEGFPAAIARDLGEYPSPQDIVAVAEYLTDDDIAPGMPLWARAGLLDYLGRPMSIDNARDVLESGTLYDSRQAMGDQYIDDILDACRLSPDLRKALEEITWHVDSADVFDSLTADSIVIEGPDEQVAVFSST